MQTNDEISQKLANNIYKSAAKLDKRINELLDLAKGEIGTLDIKCESVDIFKLTKEIVENISLEAKKKGQIIKLELPKKIPNILADKERLEQVLFNLINNAIKYNKLNGSVILRIYVKDLRVIIEVIDEGVGISQVDQLKLFQPYQRFNAKKDNFHGLGLGLALSKQLVELQNGKIWVKSEPGVGSSFYISFPLSNHRYGHNNLGDTI